MEWIVDAWGEDLALLATRATRRAILPSQRWAPLVHVVCGLLLLGAFPLVVHLGANSLFAKPKLEDLTLCSKAEVVGWDWDVRVIWINDMNASTTKTVPIFFTLNTFFCFTRAEGAAAGKKAWAQEKTSSESKIQYNTYFELRTKKSLLY